MRRLFVFGLGYTASSLALRLRGEGWDVAGTCRGDSGRAALEQAGITIWAFDGTAPLPAEVLNGTTHILASIPPDPDDPALRHHAEDIARLPGLAWTGYLSTTSVYGVEDGGWVDEDTPCRPTSERGRRRLDAERGWAAQSAHIFRLSGIYGPGRSVLDQIRAGTAQRIVKPGQAFNRIHRDDIVTTLLASIARPVPGRIYNLADDLPAPSGDVVAQGCALLGVPPPPEIAFEAAELSPMARSFWADNKRIRNTRIRQELGVRLAYPTYREGLAAILAAGG